MDEFLKWSLIPKFKINVVRCNQDVAIQIVYGNLKEPTECVNTCFSYPNNPDSLSLMLETSLNSLLRSLNFPTSIKEFQDAISQRKK